MLFVPVKESEKTKCTFVSNEQDAGKKLQLEDGKQVL